jgi:CMP-N,N'-diacetyllegionaminic acid synthase
MINQKRVLAVTLARGGSKSIPKKNIVKIAGKPLIEYTINEALKSKYIDKYIVSTDDQEIYNVCKALGASMPFLRPKELSSDTASSADALIHAVNYLSKMKEDYDYVIELMATNPLKSSSDIDICLEKLDGEDCDYVVAVKKIYDGHPSRIKYIQNGFLQDFYPEIPESRRQDLTPQAYIRCGSIYAMKTRTLLETKARYGKKTWPYVMSDESVINIDEPVDLRVAESILSK